jgi:hypothetical protein
MNKKVIRLTESDLVRIIKKVISEQPAYPTSKPGSNDEITPGTPLTDVMMLLMKKVYLRYKPLGRNGIDTNKKKDDEVLQIQKYFNSRGTLGKGQKYDLLKENGIFDGDTFWQVNNTLGSKYKEWWLKNKY